MQIQLIVLFCLGLFVDHAISVGNADLTNDVIAVAKDQHKTLTEGDRFLYLEANRMVEECDTKDGVGYFAKSGTLAGAIKDATTTIADVIETGKEVSCDAMACPSGGYTVACAVL